MLPIPCASDTGGFQRWKVGRSSFQWLGPFERLPTRVCTGGYLHEATEGATECVICAREFLAERRSKGCPRILLAKVDEIAVLAQR